MLSVLRQTVNDAPRSLRDWWLPATVASAVVFFTFALMPIMDDDRPDARRVREAIYGNRPLGLPWEIVHIGVCVLIFAPLPLTVASAFELMGIGSAFGVTTRNPFLSLLKSFQVTAGIPEVRGVRQRVAIGFLWYFCAFVGWIVLTSILGV